MNNIIRWLSEHERTVIALVVAAAVVLAVALVMGRDGLVSLGCGG